MFLHTKSVPEPRWSTSAVRRVRDGLGCGRILLGSSSDHSRILLGSSSDHSRIGIPLWFATVGSFPHCKFEGSLARNAFLRDSRCTKPYVLPYKVCPRTSMIYLCGAIACSSIVFCSSVSADRIVMAASRFLLATAAFVILLSFAAGSRKSYWSGCMKAATVICQQIFSILALVISF